MTIKVRANEELFNRWQKVGRIITNLASIVQNDMEIEIDDLQEWLNLTNQCLSGLAQTYTGTLEYLITVNENMDIKALLEVRLEELRKELS